MVDNQEHLQSGSFTRPSSRIPISTKQKLRKTVEYGILVILLGYILFPMYWFISSSIRPSVFSSPEEIIPSTLTLEHYFILWNNTDFSTFLVNSIIVAIGAVIITVVIASLGGYGLARATYRGERTMARSVLLSYMFPPIMLGIPLYMIFFGLDLLNSYIALIIARATVSLAFSLWIMWQFFQTIPLAYEEAAWICGASRLRAMYDVILPMIIPGIATISIFAFAGAWNDFTFATIIMSDPSMWTLPIGLNTFMGRDDVQWGMLLSAGVLVNIPPIILIYYVQDYLIQGFNIE